MNTVYLICSLHGMKNAQNGIKYANKQKKRLLKENPSGVHKHRTYAVPNRDTGSNTEFMEKMRIIEESTQSLNRIGIRIISILVREWESKAELWRRPAVVWISSVKPDLVMLFNRLNVWCVFIIFVVKPFRAANSMIKCNWFAAWKTGDVHGFFFKRVHLQTSIELKLLIQKKNRNCFYSTA